MPEPAAVDIVTSIAGLARAMRADPAASENLASALLLLSEALLVCRTVDEPSTPTRDAVLMRLAVLEKQHGHEKPGTRARMVRQKMGLARSTYYELRSEAREMGLVSPEQSG